MTNFAVFFGNRHQIGCLKLSLIPFNLCVLCMAEGEEEEDEDGEEEDFDEEEDDDEDDDEVEGEEDDEGVSGEDEVNICIEPCIWYTVSTWHLRATQCKSNSSPIDYSKNKDSNPLCRGDRYYP